MRISLTAFFLLLAVFSCAGEQPDQVSLHRTSKTGLQGWTHADHRHSSGTWMNSTLVIKTRQGKIKTFRSEYAFIIGWAFCHSDSCVVIQSQNAHGPYYWQLYDISSGKLLDDYYRSKADEFPEWAKQFEK